MPMIRVEFRWTSLAAFLLGLAVACEAGPARADLSISFTFEELAQGNTSKITSTQGGLTATISREDGLNLGIVDLFTVQGFGARSISNFVSPYSQSGGTLIINFSQAVSSASLQFGDGGADDDSPVTMTAFSGLNGTGTSLASSTVGYPSSENFNNGPSNIGSLTVGSPGIESLTFSSGGPFPNSLYYDNLSVVLPAVTAPEPSTLVMAWTAVVAVVGHRLYRRGSKAT